MKVFGIALFNKFKKNYKPLLVYETYEDLERMARAGSSQARKTLDIYNRVMSDTDIYINRYANIFTPDARIKTTEVHNLANSIMNGMGCSTSSSHHVYSSNAKSYLQNLIKVSDHPRDFSSFNADFDYIERYPKGQITSLADQLVNPEGRYDPYKGSSTFYRHMKEMEWAQEKRALRGDIERYRLMYGDDNWCDMMENKITYKEYLKREKAARKAQEPEVGLLDRIKGWFSHEDHAQPAAQPIVQFSPTSTIEHVKDSSKFSFSGMEDLLHFDFPKLNIKEHLTDCKQWLEHLWDVLT